MQLLKHTLDDLSQYLELMRDAGSPGVEVAPEVLKGLSLMPIKNVQRPAVPVPPVAERASAIPVNKPPAGTIQAAAPSQAASSDNPELQKIAKAIAGCKKCCLHSTRTNTVPGQGAVHPEIMFVGEAPGADEDLQGLAFVGRAGQLLTKMIEAMGYKREEVFIGNILKCRPPDNRAPEPEEMEVCLPYLKAQIAVIKPKVIIALGATAVKGLVNLTGITKLRGNWLCFEGIDLMPTYHPAYLLRNPPAKKEVWEDLQNVLKKLGRTPPRKSK